MEEFVSKLNIYIIPPALSLVIGLSLAIISVVKGKFIKENILFSLVCIWWSCLLAPAFISHHLFRGDEETILKIERFIHFFFVYVPVVNMVYILGVLKLKRKILIGLCCATSFIISLFTPTEYYFKGLYTYDWGYIAKGGVVFDIFGAYGMIVIVYLAIQGFKQLKVEENYIVRLKIKYIIFSVVAGAALTLMNIPAINGIDFYPLGNLNFIPLAILTYGVLRFRLMDIRSIIHITLIWAIVSSIVMIPNIFIFILFWSNFIELKAKYFLVFIFTWFLINYIYIRKIQPKIDQLFNKRKYNLNQVETQFIENISQLRTFGELVKEFTGALKKTLSFSDFQLIKRNEDLETFSNKEGDIIKIDPVLEKWFIENNDLIEKSLVASDPIYLSVADRFKKLFNDLTCDYILPFIQNNALVGFMIMPERLNLKQLTMDEIQFINNIRTSATISLSNSLMFQNLTNYKNNLEKMVDERTIELREARDEIWGEMELAKKIQTVLLPTKPAIDGYEISGYMNPADEVGGDYYDVINIGDIDWIVIGDVSGHGVPAGLVMMMVQTAIRVAITDNPKVDPAKLLTNINKTIAYNIKQLGEDKYMTITVFAGHKDGKFIFSGLHQDILIYRAASKSMDAIETRGFWIGILEDTNGMMENDEIELFPGDVMLLYTDGVTEAWEAGSIKNHRDPETQMYGDDRLRETFLEIGHLSTDEIKDGINNSMKNYEFDDDVTMLILKKNI